MVPSLRCALLLCVFGAAAFAGPEFINPSFESPGDQPQGWSLQTGSFHDRGVGGSMVVVDRTVAREGKASLRCSGWPCGRRSRRCPILGTTKG